MPVLAPDIGVTDEDTRLNVRVLANDCDADRDPLRVVAVNPSGTNGVIAIPQGGKSISYDPRGAFDWLPEGATAEDVPYAAVTRFSLETAGFFDADAELCLWLCGQAEPLRQEFRRGDDVHGVHRVLAKHVLG